MRWTMKCARFLLLLMPAFALVIPASAHDPRLSDSQEPGSVIVFPKFITGTVELPEGGSAPVTELEVGIVCPVGATCPEHQSVKIRFHWVCPGDQSFPDKLICRETDFDVIGSVNEKLVLVPNGVGTADGVGTRFVPPPPCPTGYLIGWVVDTSDRPIKFDGLIGDAVLRVFNATVSATATAVSAYGAIPIQAHPGLMHQAPIMLGSAGALVFDGRPGHYQAVTGVIRGDVKYPKEEGTGPFNDTFLTLLTLDVQSNRPNKPVFVDLDFYGGFGSAIGVENVRSTSTEFLCWEEMELDGILLNQLVMGRKGTFVSHPAVNAAGKNVTLLGLVETRESLVPPTRSYITPTYNDGVPVPTEFVP